MNEIIPNKPPEPSKNSREVKVFTLVYFIAIAIIAYATAQNNMTGSEIFFFNDLSNFFLWIIFVAPLSGAGIMIAVRSLIEKRVTGLVIFLLISCALFLIPQVFQAVVSVFSDSASYTNLMY